MTKTRFLLLSAAAILVAVLATHGLSVWADHGFVNYDDDDVVVSNPRVQSLTATHVGEILTRRTFHSWLPLYFLSLAADRAILGPDATGFHLVNVLLHALNAFLLVVLLTRLTRNARIAVGAGLLFAAFPGLTESVAWISSRKDVLSLTFVLGSMILAYRAVRPEGGVRTRPYALALLLLALALMTKGTALVMPLLLLAHRLVTRTEEEKRESPSLLAIAPFFAVALVFTIVHYLIAVDESVAVETAGGGLGGILLADLGVLARYVGTLLIAPVQSVAHEVVPGRFDLWVGIGIPVLAGLVAAVVLGRRRAPLLALGVLWFLLALAPFNNILPRTSLLMAERYLYVPALGAALALAWGVSRLPRGWFAGTLAALIVVLGAQTIVRTGVWADSVTLWGDAVRKAPESYLAHQKLGRALLVRGKDTEARAHLEEALRYVVLPVHEIRTRSELSILMLRQERPESALEQVKAAFVRLPEVPAGAVRDAARANLLIQRANARFALGQVEPALDDLREAARLDPDDPSAPYNAGTFLLGLGRTPEAEVVLAEAVRRNGTRPDALLHLASARLRLGKLDAAREALDRAEAAGADRELVLLLRSVLIADPVQSDALLEKAAESRPRGSRIHRELARRRLRAARDALGDGDVKRARDLARQAIEWEPQSAVIRLLNARILRAAGEPHLALAELDSAALRGGSEVGVDRERAEILVLLGAAAKVAGQDAEATARFRQALTIDVDLLDAGGMVLDGRLLRLARTGLAVGADPVRDTAFAAGLLDLLVGRAREGREALAAAAGDARDDLARAALALRGAAFAGSGLPERAEEQLREALSLEEDSPDVRLLLAEVLEIRGDAAGAKREYERVLASDVDSLSAGVGVALNLARLGEVVPALGRLNELAARHPGSAEVPRALGQFYWERNAAEPSPSLLESAEENFREALVVDPTDVRTLELLALVLASRGMADRAVPLLRRAIVLRPDRAAARTSLARLYVQGGRARLEKGELDEAESLATRAGMLAPDLVESVLLCGDVEKRRMRYAAALDFYESARRLAPTAEEPVDALAEWYRDAGYRKMLGKDAEGARADFRKALELEPKNVDLDAVKGILDTWVEREEGRRGITALLTTCQTMLREGNHGEAEKCARAALRLRPKNADAHYLLGRALLASGDTKGAEASYLAALLHRPKYAEVELDLGSLCFMSGRDGEAEIWYRNYLLHVDARSPGAAENIALARAMVKKLRERREPPDDGK